VWGASPHPRSGSATITYYRLRTCVDIRKKVTKKYLSLVTYLVTIIKFTCSINEHKQLVLEYKIVSTKCNTCIVSDYSNASCYSRLVAACQRPYHFCPLANDDENIDCGRVWACPSMAPKSVPFHGGIRAPIYTWFLGPPESTPQAASRSAHPFS